MPTIIVECQFWVTFDAPIAHDKGSNSYNSTQAYNLTSSTRASDMFSKHEFIERCICFTLQWRHSGHHGVSNHQPHDCLLSRLFRHRSKKTSKLCVTGLCEGNSPGTGDFPAQMASNAENVSIWWRHHEDEVMVNYLLLLILSRISNHMPSKMWDEITYLFPEVSSYTVQVWGWIINF